MSEETVRAGINPAPTWVALTVFVGARFIPALIDSIFRGIIPSQDT